MRSPDSFFHITTRYVSYLRNGILFLALFALAPAMSFSQGSSSAKEAIKWLKYEEGVKQAKDSNKQLLIDFSTAWCGYCKKMDRETFSDQRVIEYINENFVAIKVDGDSKREFEIDGFKTSEKRITKELYGVSGYPTFWFLESDGEKIGRQPGYQPAEQFLSLLAYVKDEKYRETKEENAPSADSTESR